MGYLKDVSLCHKAKYAFVDSKSRLYKSAYWIIYVFSLKVSGNPIPLT